MDKQAYIGTAHQFVSAFTDFKWVLSDLREEGGSVIMSGHFEGKHTGDFDLSALGLGVIPASGKMIVWPEAIVSACHHFDPISHHCESTQTLFFEFFDQLSECVLVR